MHDSDEEAEARICYELQQHGYFDVEGTNLKVIPLDPLAKKTAVRIETEVNEGLLYHLAEIRFTGNKSLGADESR